MSEGSNPVDWLPLVQDTSGMNVEGKVVPTIVRRLIMRPAYGVSLQVAKQQGSYSAMRHDRNVTS